VCGKICHRAKRHKCGCWCGGLFHGERGNAAREAFKAEWGDDPKSDWIGDGGEKWTRAMQRAYEAHEGAELGESRQLEMFDVPPAAPPTAILHACGACEVESAAKWSPCERAATLECIYEDANAARTYRCDEHAPRAGEFARVVAVGSAS
jgi:hypothetical protein